MGGIIKIRIWVEQASRRAAPRRGRGAMRQDISIMCINIYIYVERYRES